MVNVDSLRRAKRHPRKTHKRSAVLDALAERLTEREAFSAIDAWSQPEHAIKLHMYHKLLAALQAALSATTPRLDQATIKRRAERALVWEGDVRKSIHEFSFLGVPHRPDFELLLPGTKIAIEVKRGDTGGEVRSGIGQALVYSQVYDFVLYLFIDATDDRRISASTNGLEEASFIAHLWDQHNVRLVVA